MGTLGGVVAPEHTEVAEIKIETSPFARRRRIGHASPDGFMDKTLPKPGSRFLRFMRLGGFGFLLFAGIVLLVPFIHPSNAPRIIGTVHRVEVPGMGPAWMELDLQRPPRAIAFNGVHPELELQMEDSNTPPSWIFFWRHSTNPPAARISWDGQAARFFREPATGTAPLDTNAPGIPLPTVQVGDLVSMEQTRGIRLFGHGTAGRWKSVRPRWNHPTSLDQQVELETRRIEQECRTDFFKEVHDAFSLPDMLPATVTGDWSFDLRQVFHHRSERAVSVLNYVDSYTGGAHGSHGTIPINAILGPGGIEWIKLPSIFRDKSEWKPGLRRRVLEELRRQGASAALPGEPGEKSEPAMSLPDEELAALKFTATATGIQIHFDPYEAGSYAEGRYSVEIPWTQLRAWTRAEVLEAFTAAADH